MLIINVSLKDEVKLITLVDLTLITFCKANTFNVNYTTLIILKIHVAFGFDLNSCKSKVTTTTDLISIWDFSNIIKKERKCKEIYPFHENDN